MNRNILALIARETMTVVGATRVAPAVTTPTPAPQATDEPLVWFNDILGRWRFRAPRGA